MPFENLLYLLIGSLNTIQGLFEVAFSEGILNLNIKVEYILYKLNLYIYALSSGINPKYHRH